MSEYIPNNYDFPGNLAPTWPPVLGKNNDNGGEIDPLVTDVSGNKFYFNQQIRQEFATPDERAAMGKRLTTDIGALFEGWVENSSYTVAPEDPWKRTAPVAMVNGERYSYALLRRMTSNGVDRNNITVYDQRKYQLAFEGPGKFGYTKFLNDPNRPEGAPNGMLTFTPPLIPPAAPPPVDQPPFKAYEGHFWWKSVFGWVMVPYPKS